MISYNIEHRRVDTDNPDGSEFDQKMRLLELTVNLLIIRTGFGDCWNDGFNDIQRLITKLPNLAREFAAINGRLEKAITSCEQKRFEAAVCELRAVRAYLLRL